MAALERLFPQQELEAFLDHDHQGVIIHHGDLARCYREDVTSHRLPAEKLLEATPDAMAEVYMPWDDRECSEYRNMPFAEALVAYRDSATVEIQAKSTPLLQRYLPVLNELQIEFKQPRRVLVCVLSPTGNAVPMHFDKHSVFVLQLAGEKRWKLAPPTIPYPTVAVLPRVSGSPRSEPLPEYFPRRLLHRMPTSATEVVMPAGSAMFVPLGYWHETTATSDSISLIAGFRPRTFTDIYLDILREKLETLPELRRPLFELLSKSGKSSGDELMQRLEKTALDLISQDDFRG